MSSRWVVHKFGGTSLADAERYRRVVTILRAGEGERKAVVVSTMSKVTDALVELIELAKWRSESYLACLDVLTARHVWKTEALLLPRLRGQHATKLDVGRFDANPTFPPLPSHPLNGLLCSAAPERGATMLFGFKPLSPAAAGDVVFASATEAAGLETLTRDALST